MCGFWSIPRRHIDRANATAISRLTHIKQSFIKARANATATSRLTHIKQSFIKLGKQPIITDLKNMENLNQSIKLDSCVPMLALR